MRAGVTALLLAVAVGAAPADADTEPRPFGISIFDPLQFPERERSIYGVRATLFYGRHRELRGADIGGLIMPVNVNHITGDMRGAQFGLANWVDGNVYGAQLGTLNRAGGSATGFQGGFVNIAGEADRFLGQWGFVNVSHGLHHGFQVGFVNHSRYITGAQVGFVNHATRLDGLQVGLLNMRGRPRMDMPRSSPTVLPLVTWSF